MPAPSPRPSSWTPPAKPLHHFQALPTSPRLLWPTSLPLARVGGATSQLTARCLIYWEASLIIATTSVWTACCATFKLWVNRLHIPTSMHRTTTGFEENYLIANSQLILHWLGPLLQATNNRNERKVSLVDFWMILMTYNLQTCLNHHYYVVWLWLPEWKKVTSFLWEATTFLSFRWSLGK